MNLFELMAKTDLMLKNGEIKESDVHDECDIAFFRLVRDGQHLGANKKRNSRASISLPRVVCGENIVEYDDWVYYTVAIKKEVWKKIVASGEEGGDGEKQ